MQNKTRKLNVTVKNRKMGGKWSIKYKKGINCNRPKGFSQKTTLQIWEEKPYKTSINKFKYKI